jgi:CBS domain-containing protein
VGKILFPPHTWAGYGYTGVSQNYLARANYFILDFLVIIMSLIQVSDFMVIKPVTMDPDTPLIEVAIKMRENRIGSLILVENNKPIGIITERDLVWRVVANSLDVNSLKASDVCSKPVLTISENSRVEEAMELMKEYMIRRLVVVNDDDEVSGIITSDDIAINIESISKELALEYITMSRSIRK